MNQATFRFYAELRDFLDPSYEAGFIAYRFWGTPAVKDAIEALGVPHPEVGLILINGEPSAFEAHIMDQDRVSVYPAFRTLDLPQSIGLQPPVQVRPSFIADIHLGQLARYLRMLGFHCQYKNDAQDADLAERSADSGGVLLTRDQELLKRSIVRRGYYIRATDPDWQLVEVLRRFELGDQIEPFRCCMECSGLLIDVKYEDIKGKVPAGVGEEMKVFRRCRECHRVYWRGSHVDRMLDKINWLHAQIDSAY